MNRWLLFLLIAAAVILGVVIPLMDNDAAHHAAIALHATETGGYTPDFDKPHLQFWMVGGSFAWMGVGSVVYKLSSLLFVLLTLLSTYKLGEYLVPRRGIGTMSTLILASMIGFILSSSVDIRMDAILTGAVAFGIWQGIISIGGGGIGGGDSISSRRSSLDRFRLKPLIGLAIGLAMSLSVKGMYGVVVIGIAMLCYMVAARRLKWLISPRALIVLALFFLFIIPELVAYYNQFGWQGVRFILYEQNFIGLGSGMGIESGDEPLFYVQSLLWVTLPWSLLLIYFAGRSIVKRKMDAIYALTIISSFLVIILLSFSSFKLPYYLNPLFPLLAIYLASQLQQIELRTPLMRGVAVTQKIIVAVIILLAAVVNYYCFPFTTLWFAIIYGVMLLAIGYTLFRPWLKPSRIVSYSVAASAILWIGLNGNFYPQLLSLQAGSEMGEMVKKQSITPSEVAMYHKSYSPSFDIHHGGLHKIVGPAELQDSNFVMPSRYLFIDHISYADLQKDSIVLARKMRIVKAVPDYLVTKLTLPFLNPSTRNQLIDTVYLVDTRKL